MNLFWYGARQSDIQYTDDLFDGSITLFGDNENNNVSFCNENPKRINHNIITVDQDNFTIQRLLELHRNHPTAKCMFYNPSIFYNFEKIANLRDMIVCLNDKDVLRCTSDKLKFRELMNGQVSFIKYLRLKREECSYKILSEKFESNGGFIVQVPISCGGDGTYVLRDDKSHVLDNIEHAEEYLAMEYYDNSLSVNMHAVIYDDAVVFTPGSLQIVIERENRLIYRGADFITYLDIPSEQRDRFYDQCKIVCDKLHDIGYRGVVGVDGLITADGQVFIVEVNNRFQASSQLINKALNRSGLPSLHKMNLDAFNGVDPTSYATEVEKVVVPFSTYIFLSADNDFHANKFLEYCKNESHIVEITLDGFNKEQDKERDCYLYKCTFDTNITSISPDGGVMIYENIVGPSLEFYNSINKHKPLETKIALLNQGVRIEVDALRFMQENGGVRPATNSAIDIILQSVNNMTVNCPQSLKFSKLSPFTIRYTDPYKLSLFYYGSYLSKISIWPEDGFQNNSTSNGTSFAKVAYLSTDRLRVHHTTQCLFKRMSKSCRFCDIEICSGNIDSGDLEEVIKFYINNVTAENNNGVGLRHFLVGGQSDNAEVEYQAIIDTIKIIRKYSTNDIYVMCLPPSNTALIRDIKDAGATEIAFNIEIFDSEQAKMIMPGKGYITREQYYNALKSAVNYFSKGQVRSLVVVGLEKASSFFNGIEKLCSIGVQPVLSVFRPLKNTSLYNYVSPSNETLRDIFNKVEQIGSKYNIHVGPECVYCQNNTLSLPTKHS